jgi:signal transduction histidine kinase
MLRSIRTRLVLSYALIIVLCLLLAGLGAIVLINRYQRDAVLSRHRVAAGAIAQQVQALMALRFRVPQIASRVSDQITRLGLRALLIDKDGVVVADTSEERPLTGKTLAIPLEDLISTPRGGAVFRRYRNADGQDSVLIILPLQPPPEGALAPAAVVPSHVVVAVPEQELKPAWRELVRPLTLAGLVALVLSVIVSVLLSRSITKPILAMTDASAKMAEGDYEQVVRAKGQDEVARLAESFNRMAREVERSRQSQRDLIANVSHDLKTPLTSIQGFSQAVLEGAIHDQEGYQRAAQIIKDEAEGMGELIERLLDLAHFDAGEVIRERVAIRPAELVERVAARFAPVAAENNLALAHSASEGLPAVQGDKARLEQALSNLIDNAFRYTPQGGRIDIHAGELRFGGGRPQHELPCGMPPDTPRDGHWLAITVQDNGHGIAEQDLPRIFERFYQADKSRGGSKGAGLGLAIAKEIVEAHGGTIGVTSQQGQGSCFSILLPVA